MSVMREERGSCGPTRPSSQDRPSGSRRFAPRLVRADPSTSGAGSGYRTVVWFLAGFVIGAFAKTIVDVLTALS